jgi:hypothetical protein
MYARPALAVRIVTLRRGPMTAAGWRDNVVRKEELQRAHPDLRVVTPDTGRHWIAAWLRPDGTEETARETDLGRLLDRLEPVLAARRAS